jgi:predicted nucleotidyltransferase component of viral defense system
VKQPLTNVAASVRQRLLNLAQERGEEFQSLLIRYANERLIYRLAASAHVDDFILKGAMLLYVWSPYPFRATQDVDLLGRGAVTAERLVDVFRGLCASKVADDGLNFQADTVRVGLIRQDDEYGGFRVKLQAKLTAARLDLQVDVGVGDAVAQLSTIDYPTLLEFPAPRLRAYSREAAIAEKFHAMVDHGFENSRMKDFFDVWALSREFAFDGGALAAAIGATFDRRGTPIPASTPVAFTPPFAADPTKAKQWKAFLVRARVRKQPPPFEVVLARVAEFLQPVAEAARLRAMVRTTWTAGGPWRTPAS